MTSISPVTNILKTLETSSSVGMFAKDTLGCLGAKTAVSRSNDERREIAFAELSESALFYFSAPAIAKMSSDYFAEKYNIGKNLLKEPVDSLKNVPKDKLKKVKSAKLGQIGTVFALMLPIIYAIAPMRNIMTYSKKGKDEFVSVVELKENKTTAQEEEAQKKAKKLIKNTAAVCAAGLAATGLMLKGLKNEKIYKKAEPVINKVLKTLDFTKTRDLTTAHYGALIYPVSIASYFAASRDKYEKKENAVRFSFTVPLLFFGEKLIEKPIHKAFDKKFGTKVMEEGKIKTYNEIMQLPEKIRNQYLKSKNGAYALTFLTNTMFIAAGVGILNRISTKKRYEKEHQNEIKTEKTENERKV